MDHSDSGAAHEAQDWPSQITAELEREALEHARRGDEHRDRREWREAASAYEEALRRDGRLNWARVQMAHARKEAGDPEGAAQLYRHALELDPGNADIWLNLGHALKLSGRPGQAHDAYARSAELDPACPHPAQELAALDGIIAPMRARFDPAYYRLAHLRDAEPEVDPFDHYLATVRAASCSPSAEFDERFYRATYPDVVQSIRDRRMSCGFEHYLRIGEAEGRLPRKAPPAAEMKSRAGQPAPLPVNSLPLPASVPDRPKVSIVIPAFNGGPYLAPAIESALAQSWPVIEVIVVNDGSTDDGHTRRVAQSYGGRIRYIEKPNGGVATALNAGIAAMEGDYFSWLSHDDLYDPRKVERQVRALQRAEAGAIAFGDYDFMDQAGAHIGRAEATAGFDPSGPLWAVLEGRLNGCTMLIPRACFDSCGLFDPGLPTTQDYELWFRMARRFRFHPVPGVLVRQRIHPAQGSRDPRHLEEAGLLWAAMLDSLSPEEMLRHAPSELAFLRRVERNLRRFPYPGTFAAVARLIDERLRRERVTLIWATRPSRPNPPIDACSRFAEAGLPQPEIRLLCLDEHAAGATGVGTALRLAAAPGSAEIAVVSDASAPLDGTMIREAVLRVAAGEADGVLHEVPEGEGAILPRAFRSMVLSQSTAAEALARSEALGVPPENALGLAGHLAVGGYEPPPSFPRPAPPSSGGFGEGLDPAKPTLLLVVHEWGGGTIRYAETLARHVRGKVNLAFAWGREDRALALSTAGPDQAQLWLDLPGELDRAVDLLRGIGVARADLLHTGGLEAHAPLLLDRLGVPFDLTFLDYFLVATTPHLTGKDGGWVTEAAIASQAKAPSGLVARAARRIACSRDLAERLRRLAPGLGVMPAKLPEPHRPERFRVTVPPLRAGERLRVLVLGAFAEHKGRRTVLEVARRIATAGLPIEIHALGDVRDGADPSWPVGPALRLHGRYADGQLTEFICGIRPHLAWFPAEVPETHCFALSDAMLHGLPVLARDLGAFAERLAGRPASWVLPIEGDDPAGDWLRALLKLHLAGLALPSDVPQRADLPLLAERFYEDAYLSPLTAATVRGGNGMKPGAMLGEQPFDIRSTAEFRSAAAKAPASARHGRSGEFREAESRLASLAG